MTQRSKLAKKAVTDGNARARSGRPTRKLGNEAVSQAKLAAGSTAQLVKNITYVTETSVSTAPN